MCGMSPALREPDERLSAPGASCSLWWSGERGVRGHRAGAIGHVRAADAASLAALLARACEALARQGCTLALGPMDGSTWGRYRAVVQRGPEPAFFLEPDEPDHVAAGFVAAGFGVAARYRSALEAPIACGDPRLAGVESRLASEGIRIRPLDPAHWDAELRRIHALCMASFRASFLFQPIAVHEFVALHRPLGALVEPGLALVAEEGGRFVAMFFSFADRLEAERTGRATTLVVKTIATLPERRCAGLARVLAERVAVSAHRKGFRRAIHALMHEANVSAAWSAQAGRVFRRYALFAKRLADASLGHA